MDVIDKYSGWINETWNKIDRKLSKTALLNRNSIPYVSVNGKYNDMSEKDISWWTNGFWGGMMWLMYKATGNEEYRKTAETSERLMDEALKDYKSLHHDVGFMWHLLSGANFKITGSKSAENKNLFMASVLFSRYNIDGNFIRAWNDDVDENAAGYSIIDCLMNIPLLYWASERIGDDRFKKIAVRHMEMALRDHIRKDGSVNHIVEHYTDRPGVKQALGGQGYSSESCWTRGLAWAIYGSVLSYKYVGKQEYLDAAKKTADYFIENCKKTDMLTPIDFLAPPEPVYYDSTAGMCAACGIIELSKQTKGAESESYLEKAIKILCAADSFFCDYSDDEEAIVLVGSEKYPHDKESLSGVHIPIIYGDFFFVEAMTKLKGVDFCIW